MSCPLFVLNVNLKRGLFFKKKYRQAREVFFLRSVRILIGADRPFSSAVETNLVPIYRTRNAS